MYGLSFILKNLSAWVDKTDGAKGRKLSKLHL